MNPMLGLATICRVGIINKGKLIFVGTYDELKKQFAEDGKY